jgi:hypothetical protein
MEVLQFLAAFMDSIQIGESEVTGFWSSSDILAGRKKSRRWLLKKVTFVWITSAWKELDYYFFLLTNQDFQIVLEEQDKGLRTFG